MYDASSYIINLELTRDRLRSFVRSFVRFRSFDFVRHGNYGNVLLPKFTRHSLVIFRPRSFYPCTRYMEVYSGFFILPSINRCVTEYGLSGGLLGPCGTFHNHVFVLPIWPNKINIYL